MTIELITADCVAWMKDQPEDRFDLVLGSPPYCDARTYGIGAQRGCVEWVEWMLEVTEAAARICRGPVLWVAAGVTRARNYWPAVEGLMWEWWKRGGTHELYRPCVFHRVGIPGSGGKDWFRSDWEYVACFKKPGILPWADNTACGHPPKWAPGGEMAHRVANGCRVNQRGPVGGPRGGGGRTVDGESKPSKLKANQANGYPSHKVTKLQTRRKANGERPGRRILNVERGEDGKVTAEGRHNNEQDYTEPVLANPGNVIKCNVGGGVMGHKLAHENEAPYPEKLVEFFVNSLCPPGGLCLDPFSGSGTTVAVCERLGRNGVGVDIRPKMTELARRRCRDIQRELI